jgi:hypothetical protein
MQKEIKNPDSKDFSPSSFMRARRPELFSDSTVDSEPRLTREVFEYHLETLTNRKQETEFEHFCRKLAEKEICPNLLPQTGPTGGGDSKVDTETYPVSDGISLRWYEGVAREADQERWAFAFSAKRDWRTKIQSDVKKIVETHRGYKLVYFITNQFVSDKARAEVEDQLTQQHSLNVRVLDRTWIVNCVFEHSRLELAISALSLTEYDIISQKKIGPNDSQRERELQELEQQIQDPDRYRGVEYQLAEDCLDSTLLSRNLEHGRTEVDGKFLRAERIARKIGYHQQLLRIAYAKAWTAFWWYDDFDALNELYDRVEELAIESTQADDLKLLSNLWGVLSATIVRGQLDSATAKFEKRTESLRAALQRLTSDPKHPINALKARTSLALMDLHWVGLKEPDRLDEALTELKDILVASEGIGTYPIEPLATIIQELGEQVTASTAYDSLFEYLIDLLGRRSSDAQAGLYLLERGIQLLNTKRYYEAIRLLGRAQEKLAMEEHRREWIVALAGCGFAYQDAGLLWAARTNFLAAANLAFSKFTETGTLPAKALHCLVELVSIELQLGRIPCVLAWMECASFTAHHLLLEGEAEDKYLNQRRMQDMVLGILLLRVDFWELKWLQFLPFVLEQLQLDASWTGLLYALGYEDRLREEKVIPAGQDKDQVLDFFSKWLAQPAAEDVPLHPELLNGRTVNLRSKIIGCDIVIQSGTELSSLYLSETLLGSLESFLATSIGGEVFPHRSSFHIVIKTSDFAEELPETKFLEDGEGVDLEIIHSKRFEFHSIAEIFSLRLWLIDVVANIISRTVFVKNPEAHFKQLASEESAFSRTLSFADVSHSVENILGKSPKLRLWDWEPKSPKEVFPIKQQSPWDHALWQPVQSETEPLLAKLGKGTPPQNLINEFKNTKHSDIEVFSLINVALWDKAGWSGVLYITTPENKTPPFLALGFANIEAGKLIFQEWMGKLGQHDTEEKLRISVVTGIDKEHPFNYRLVIGMNPKVGKKSEVKYMVLASRMHTMLTTNHNNLDRFLAKFREMGWFVILPVQMINPTELSTPIWDFGIVKREINVRPAWEIGPNDPDAVAITPSDDPTIPDGITNAPVLETLNRKN